MIRARLKKSYPAGADSRAFSLDVQFEAGPGISVLFGPSGSGKTLTLDCIAGFVRPDEGRILVEDEILFDGGTRVYLPPQQRRCGYVLQNYALFPHMSLRDNLDFALGSARSLDRHRRIREMLERFQLGEVAGRYPHELSGGQKQRGSIARALLANPRLLLLDEPAQGLDAVLRQELYSILRQVQRDFPMPSLLVTHDLDEALELGAAMHVFREGRIVQSNSPQMIVDAPASAEIARLLGVYNLLPAEILALDPGRRTSRLRIGEWEVGGPYYPGHLIGDRVTLCVHPARVRVAARNGTPRTNEMAMELEHAAEGGEFARLRFAGGFRAEIPRPEWEEIRRAEAFAVELPASALRLLKG